MMTETAKKKRILIADDDVDLARLLKKMLDLEGYEAATVPDGGAAVAHWRVTRPDLLVLDVNMPVKNGIDVCAEVRAQDPRVLILILTGQAKVQTNTVQGLAAGADDYLTKPFGPKELVARIKALFRRQEV